MNLDLHWPAPSDPFLIGAPTGPHALPLLLDGLLLDQCCGLSTPVKSWSSELRSLCALRYVSFNKSDILISTCLIPLSNTSVGSELGQGNEYYLLGLILSQFASESTPHN